MQKIVLLFLLIFLLLFFTTVFNNGSKSMVPELSALISISPGNLEMKVLKSQRHSQTTEPETLEMKPAIRVLRCPPSASAVC